MEQVLFQRRGVQKAIVHIIGRAPAQWTRGPWDPAVDGWKARAWDWGRGTTRMTAPVAARTEDPVPPGESRSPRAVKLAFPLRLPPNFPVRLRLVGGELAIHVTAVASLGCPARSKGCSALGKVGCYELSIGP